MTALLALLPPVLGALRNPWVLLVIACVVGAGGTGWYRMRWEHCVEARAGDRLAAEQAKSAAIEKAQATSDRIIAEQAQALAVTAAKVGGITERILHIPVATACAQSPAMKAATEGVRELFTPK